MSSLSKVIFFPNIKVIFAPALSIYHCNFIQYCHNILVLIYLFCTMHFAHLPWQMGNQKHLHAFLPSLLHFLLTFSIYISFFISSLFSKFWGVFLSLFLFHFLAKSILFILTGLLESFLVSRRYLPSPYFFPWLLSLVKEIQSHLEFLWKGKLNILYHLLLSLTLVSFL